MSVFDLFRGFFGVPGGHHPGRRDPFFDAMTHDDDDDEDDEDGFHYDGFRGEEQDPFDSAWRFGFSFGPDGMRIREPPMFGHVLREMEEIFSQLGRWEGHPESGHFGWNDCTAYIHLRMPSGEKFYGQTRQRLSYLATMTRDVPHVVPPPPQDRAEKGRGRSSRNPLRDFMLKYPDSDTRELPREPRGDHRPSYESPEFHGWTPFSRFNDIWRQGPHKTPEQEHKGDRDLDSAVSSGGLDQILTPPAGQAPNQPRTRSFFQSVTVTKVVKPDGSVEERRTVRDGQGNEETTVTRSGGSGISEGPDHPSGPMLPGDHHHFSDLRDDDSLFSRFFGGFK